MKEFDNTNLGSMLVRGVAERIFSDLTPYPTKALIEHCELLESEKEPFFYELEVLYIAGIVAYVKECCEDKSWNKVVSIMDRIIGDEMHLPLGEDGSEAYTWTQQFLDRIKASHEDIDIMKSVLRSALFSVKRFIRRRIFENDDYLLKIKKFIDNEGLLDASVFPIIGEPFYEDYVKCLIDAMDLKLGETVTVTYWDGKQDAKYQGIVIDKWDKMIDLLIEGKKVWQSKKNVMRIDYRYIWAMSIIKESSGDFDIYKINPGYVSPEERAETIKQDADKVYEIRKEDAEVFHKLYPDADIQKECVLHLSTHLYWPYADTVDISSEVFIVNKDDTKTAIPKTCVRQVYPNKNWYTTCMKGADGVILPYDSLEQLQQIKFVACVWTIQLEGNQEMKVLSMNYPVFEKNEKGYHIYSVCMWQTTFLSYAESLEESFFAEDLLLDFETLAVISKEGTLFLKGMPEDDNDDAGSLIDVLMVLNEYDLQKRIDSWDIANREDINDYAEVFVCRDTISGDYHFSDHHYRNHNDARKKLSWLQTCKG